MPRPRTQFVGSAGTDIAYQVHGAGEVDLAIVTGPASHVDLLWDLPSAARALDRAGSFARVIRHDRRGTGLSGPLSGEPTLEEQMQDMIAVLDAAGAEQPVLMGTGEASRMCALFAATHPARTRALIMFGASAAGSDTFSPDLLDRFRRGIESGWQDIDGIVELFAPSRFEDTALREWWVRWLPHLATPTIARRLTELFVVTDISDVLPAIRVPTLVIHRTDDRVVPIAAARKVADQIAGARFIELPGDDAVSWIGDTDAVLDEVEEFITGARRSGDLDRVLATVLFTDIADSTRQAAELGDRRWRELLERHNALVRGELSRWRGVEVKTAGDGFLATFDGPARGIRCAQAIVAGARGIGLGVRAGMHTGECERMGSDLGGMAVHIGARVGSLAEPGEVLVSSTVRDLVVGSDLRFEDRGAHELKGVPGEWRVHAVLPEP